jgi:hypothetical protein
MTDFHVWRRRRLKGGQVTSVSVAYDGGIDSDLDRRVRRIASFQCGREQGSGVPCVTTGKRALIPLQRTETHNARVYLYSNTRESGT